MDANPVNVVAMIEFDIESDRVGMDAGPFAIFGRDALLTGMPL